MGDQSTQIARALTESAKAISNSHSVEDTLNAIVQEACRSVPGFNHIGVSVIHRDGKIETMAGTDLLVWELDELQYKLSEGPCVDSMTDDKTMILVEHAQHEQRWPRFMPQAVQQGLRAQLALRLYTDGETLGGLNLYSTEAESVDEDAIEIAELFASHAAIALGHARHEHNLNEALVSRKIIGQAIGIVMERYQISEDRAFHFLVRASSTSNIKLRTVAQEVVDTANERFTVSG